MNKLHYILMLLFFAFPLNLFAEQRFYGIYSNMVSSGGEPSGFGMFFLHDGRSGTSSDSVLFQFSEGWPQYPELLDCCGCRQIISNLFQRSGENSKGRSRIKL
jgi:hypothetical protein